MSSQGAIYAVKRCVVILTTTHTFLEYSESTQGRLLKPCSYPQTFFFLLSSGVPDEGPVCSVRAQDLSKSPFNSTHELWTVVKLPQVYLNIWTSLTEMHDASRFRRIFTDISGRPQSLLVANASKLSSKSLGVQYLGERQSNKVNCTRDLVSSGFHSNKFIM